MLRTIVKTVLTAFIAKKIAGGGSRGGRNRGPSASRGGLKGTILSVILRRLGRGRR